MNKVLASLLMIGMVAAMAGAGTFAYFTDTETSTGNAITAGEIDLTVNDMNPLSGPVVTINDIKPCWTELWVKKVVVTNNPGVLTMKIFDIVNDGGDDSYNGASSEPEYEAEGGPGNWEAIDNISTQIEYDLSIYSDDGDGGYDTDDTLVAEIYAFPNRPTLDSLESVEIELATIDPDTTYWIVQSFHLQPGAGNVYQGDVCTFSEEFSVINTGDPNGEDLNGYGFP